MYLWIQRKNTYILSVQKNPILWDTLLSGINPGSTTKQNIQTLCFMITKQCLCPFEISGGLEKTTVYWFIFYQADILATKSTHEMIIFTKFYKDWRKLTDFLLIVKFWAWELFFTHPLFGFFGRMCGDFG